MFGMKKRIFAGKQRLHDEPFCPVMSNDNGYHELLRGSTLPHNPGALGNTGSFGPVPDLPQRHQNPRRFPR